MEVPVVPLLIIEPEAVLICRRIMVASACLSGWAFLASVDNHLLASAANRGIACGIVPRRIVVANAPLVVTSQVIQSGRT